MTKDIQLSGLGNALVDVQFQVTFEELEALKIPKSTMQLADIERQREVLDSFSHYKPHLCSGGSAANTVIAFAQFGGKAGYSTRIGADNYGRFYSQEFEELGVELHATPTAEQHTGTCIVLITPDADRTLHTSLGVNMLFNPEDVDENAIARSEWLYLEGYKFTEESGTAAIETAIEYAKKHGTKIAVSFSDAFIVNVFRSQLDRALKSADLIFCNELEATSYTGDADGEAAFKTLLKSFENVAVTRAANGSLIHWDGATHQIPAYPANPIDTTGAGDMYAAGFLYGITHGHAPDRAGRLGSYASAKIVSQFGARLQMSHKQVRDEVLFGMAEELLKS